MKATNSPNNSKLLEKIKSFFGARKPTIFSDKAGRIEISKKSKRFEPHEFVKSICQQESFSKYAEELYKWNGHIFERVSHSVIADTAYKWLVRNESFVASDVNARACVMALVRHVESLPETDKTIIACKNAYLKMGSSGIEILQPSKEHGIRHALACEYQPERRKEEASFSRTVFVDF
jgi:hypothetical protein